MLRITRTADGVFKLSGQMSAENLSELETLFSAETSGRRILLDLKDLTLVDQDIVSFLKRSEANGIKLENCPTLYPAVDEARKKAEILREDCERLLGV